MLRIYDPVFGNVNDGVDTFEKMIEGYSKVLQRLLWMIVSSLKSQTGCPTHVLFDVHRFV